MRLVRRRNVTFAGVAIAAAVALTACSSGPATPSATATGGAGVTTRPLEQGPTPSSGPATPAATGKGGAGVTTRPLEGGTTRRSAAEQARLDEQLRDAAWADDVARATTLVRQGADVNAKDETVQSAYLIATSEGHLELLRLALARGAAVDDKDSWNGTGLIRAAERGHALVVGELLQAGIDRDHVNRIGYQAVHEAVWLGRDTPAYLDTLRVLVAGGVELTRRSRDEGLTPLQMARDRVGVTSRGRCQQGCVGVGRGLGRRGLHEHSFESDVAALAGHLQRGEPLVT